MIHTMPDKTVRVTSRFPNGHGTIFFDLAEAHGFTLEEDRHEPHTLVLKAAGCYGAYAARYGDLAEAEADLADPTRCWLTGMPFPPRLRFRRWCPRSRSLSLDMPNAGAGAGKA